MTGFFGSADEHHHHGATAMSKVERITKAAFLAAGFACLLTGAGLPIAAAAAPKATAHVFKVGKRPFQGRPKTICQIEGKWADGQPFNYDAWDTCKKIMVKAASLAEYKDWAPRGRKGALTVSDIPAGTEVVEISNDYSSVLVFRDRRGNVQDVLIRD